MTHNIIFGGHRGMGATDFSLFQSCRDIAHLPTENTIESIIRAFQVGASYIETDVILLQDDQVICLHDVVPEHHFFDEKIPPDYIHHLSFSQLRNYTSGSNKRGQVATLQEVLEATAKHAPTDFPFCLNIELKGLQKAGIPFEDNSRLLERVAEIIKSGPIAPDRIILSSASLQDTINMSYLLPEARYAHIYYELDHTDPMYADTHDDLGMQYLPFTEEYAHYVYEKWMSSSHHDAQILYAHPETLTVTPQMIITMKEYGWGLNVWDYRRFLNPTLVMDYQTLYTQCMELNVPITFITDYIPEMRKALNLG